MAVTSLDIDDSVLQKVLRLSGLHTKKDAVNLALREYAERHERIAAYDHFFDLAQDWDYESWRARHEREKEGLE
ncbi:type II toxin-antitoxin system VapB family antitoxin [Glycomyces salinus]|uniref:type II toxin-antitoxin system VapB family antitoxin n=1 Tax=Glycomyces salinus TaxID=980294 RepID=UPI0018ED66D6|nr:type II toxin-antitoxin system VapB family antitoxin [Glycomyces salinus]